LFVPAFVAGTLFACRHCYELAYASQQETTHERGLLRIQKIRARVGGTHDIFEEFPPKPKGMHHRTYYRLREAHDCRKRRLMSKLLE
jgi:hypothetical protein